MRLHWASFVLTELQQGRSISVQPKGHSMTGLISDGDTITIKPCHPADLAVGDIVLARIQGRRYSHLVLHLILERRENTFLIGSYQGRIDGWVEAANIFGKAVQIDPEH